MNDIEKQNLLLKIEQAKSLLMRWCNDSLDMVQIRQLERESMSFCLSTQTETE